MSGAAGHLMHLHENRSLTFDDLIDVLTQAFDGRLEKVTEKFDGINIVFTWDNVENKVKIARNGTDISSGGMNKQQLLTRFANRGNITLAFTQAYDVLQQAISALTPNELNSVFSVGNFRDRWYSAEVVFPTGTNTVNYDANCIIFHEQPIFESTPTGVERCQASSGVKILSSAVSRMQRAIELRGWMVMGPVVVNMQRLVDRQALDTAIGKIDAAISMVGLSRSSTIKDYISAMSFDRAKSLGLNDYVASKVAQRLLNEPSAPNVTQLVKMSPGHKAQITNLVMRDKIVVAEFIKPIELAISDFACEILKGMHSVLVKNGNAELDRIQQLVNDAIDFIKTSGNIDVMLALEKHLSKLRTANNITSSMEGIVFVFKGQAYKMTGAWAPAHQILSLYQRST